MCVLWFSFFDGFGCTAHLLLGSDLRSDSHVGRARLHFDNVEIGYGCGGSARDEAGTQTAGNIVCVFIFISATPCQVVLSVGIQQRSARFSM